MDLGKKLRERIEQKKYVAIKKLMVEAANQDRYKIELLKSRFDDYSLTRLLDEKIKASQYTVGGFNYITLSWAE